MVAYFGRNRLFLGPLTELVHNRAVAVVICLCVCLTGLSQSGHAQGSLSAEQRKSLQDIAVRLLNEKLTTWAVDAATLAEVIGAGNRPAPHARTVATSKVTIYLTENGQVSLAVDLFRTLNLAELSQRNYRSVFDFDGVYEALRYAKAAGLTSMKADETMQSIKRAVPADQQEKLEKLERDPLDLLENAHLNRRFAQRQPKFDSEIQPGFPLCQYTTREVEPTGANADRMEGLWGTEGRRRDGVRFSETHVDVEFNYILTSSYEKGASMLAQFNPGSASYYDALAAALFAPCIVYESLARGNAPLALEQIAKGVEAAERLVGLSRSHNGEPWQMNQAILHVVEGLIGTVAWIASGMPPAAW